MKSLYVLILVNACLSLKTSVTKLSAPNEIGVTVLDPPSFEVSWNIIKSGDNNDPVVGYKVKIWEVKNIKSAKYVFADEELKKIQKEKEPTVDLISEPDGIPAEILTSAEENKAIYRNVKLDVTYEIRVQAYMRNENGPMSNAVRIKLDK